ncbi:MAG TPA: IS1/IS6 family transposase [Candidatus Pacearchaeota archaeon]|nr:IS1/IS6 family transposase [Candidatus Pacearchaeota archaeon]HDZ61209.1 IS1/IS6 family transposase [Candidatus Pacearchaeota archaeon]
MKCIYCNSLLTVKNGYSEKGVQRYKCNDCKKRFCEKGIFARMRFPKEVITNALFLRLYPLSTRNVKRVLRKLNYIKVSHVSIYNWVLKFARHLCKFANIFPLRFTNLWHVDEKFIKVRRANKKRKKEFAYLWIVSDSKNNVLATHVSFARDIVNAKIVLQKAKQRTGFIPEILVSDGLQSYKKAVKKIFGKKTRHVIAHFKAKNVIHKGKWYKLSNNRAESINRFYALWLHVCKGFKRLDNANLWIEFFTVNYNYLIPRGEKEEVKVEWKKVPMLIKNVS